MNIEMNVLSKLWIIRRTSVAWQLNPCQAGRGVNVWVTSCSTCGIHVEFSIPKLVLFEIYQNIINVSQQLWSGGTSTYCKNSKILFAALWKKLSILSQNRGNL
jgi:hypothetical protein